MSKLNKRMKDIYSKVDTSRTYTAKEALKVLKEMPQVKFDQSLELAIKLGVDPRKADQQVRGTVSLPKGTGKTVRVAVLAQGEKATEAKNAGADVVGALELVEKIKEGWLEFDALITTPDLMREVGKLGKVLGPRGLMPTPKAGTVTTDIGKAVQEIKAGKVEFKVDKNSAIQLAFGKLSFPLEDALENFDALFTAIQRAKPSSLKGAYIESIHLSSTMGPGLKLNVSG
ncbi:MAG: 50S ribosomal protein L1 [Chlamydiae bacterium]|nr:50S ribosomal protein L1 [Chlamydiota bacterium]